MDDLEQRNRVKMRRFKQVIIFYCAQIWKIDTALIVLMNEGDLQKRM